MIIGIDLHNIRDGGGINYIRNLLEQADTELDDFTAIHLFGAPATLANFIDRPWLAKHAFAALEGPLPARLWFVRTRLPRELHRAGCDVLYNPGGVFPGGFRPYVTISRNMMPFHPEFWSMYPPFSFDRLRLRLLRRVHAATFARANGMIYLSKTARTVISPMLSRQPKRVDVIPHGVDRGRFHPLVASRRKPGDRFVIIYPSRLEPYKHQIEVIRAFALIARRYPQAELHLCGPINPAYAEKVDMTIAALGEEKARIRLLGEVPNATLPALYRDSDLLLFASSCENLPSIVIEAMSSGIPICSSDRSPMPEIIRDSGLYFDPEKPESIARSVAAALDDWEATCARQARALDYAAQYSWTDTARATFRLITTAGAEDRHA